MALDVAGDHQPLFSGARGDWTALLGLSGQI